MRAQLAHWVDTIVDHRVLDQRIALARFAEERGHLAALFAPSLRAVHSTTTRRRSRSRIENSLLAPRALVKHRVHPLVVLGY
ncbi:MAG TPA: hypothetical protein VHT91_41435, partial [Kofleriaceae bacterium]|nr:hypothetical protein [Kofleriaceae bacterium]